MMQNTLDLLKELCDANGVSGFEKEVGRIIAKKIKDYCDKLYFDKTGNLIAFKKGKKSPSKTIMYAAHLDEVGMMIKHINEDGTLLFDQVGMVPEVLASKRVVIGKNRIPGVICSKPVHLIKEGASGPSFDSMYIDIGSFSAQESEKLGVYAEYAAFENDFTVFGNGKKIRSKAIDDRIGCAAMVEMIKGELEYDSYFVFTVGEEIGGAGAVVAVREIKPEIAVVLESTTASDLPANEGADRVCAAEMGVVIPFMDGGTLYDRQLYTAIRKIADDSGIKTQTKSRVAGGTDAASIQRSIDGVRVCAVSLPCRYIHTASCVASVSDVYEYMKLVKAIDSNAEALIQLAKE